ncbi:Leucine aminopeptidase 1 [Hondaea fermentalgiana]|uniref:Leucine aminopeptidase 1 n=1 Tax=Hondaea fermentalgiana TaxID=2315210 RepID=A0A2R5GLB9_9STRA|nr:Leucine aminopeptidase 1 [Hondaea fermentalgiana]|eukprot:GBG29423.1 Leucine aminopeptidase 1 [Hondaea fermentalgiana]
MSGPSLRAANGGVPAKLQFFDASADAVAPTPTTPVVVVTYADNDLANVPTQLEAALSTQGLEALRHLASNVAKPSRDAARKFETHVKISENEWQRIALCVLPSHRPSRHAAKGHPHALADIVGSAAGGGNAAIFLLLKDPQEEGFAACCAVARAFPTYSLKSSDVQKSERASSTPTEVRIFVDLQGDLLSVGQGTVGPKEMNFVAAMIQESAALVDMPTNILQVTSYVKRIEELVSQTGLPVEVKVIQGEELCTQGFGGIYGVGKAAENPPALVILSHKPETKSSASVCLIGKGIVYDTGGLSIKSKTGMPGMKRDMGGSAGCLGGFLALVNAGGIGQEMHCLLALAENSVASNATRPDDVHTFYSGKTVEINNTDAEGRLVMADALAYAVKHLNPELLINMATLTGAQSSATGLKHAAVFTNLDEVEALAVQAGQRSGDLVHPLPYTPEFFRGEFKSEIADMKNSQKNRSNAGCAAPATFLSNHIEPYLDQNKAWLHIDMASPAENKGKATGYGVALLFTLLKSRM